MEILDEKVSELFKKFNFLNCLETGTIRSFHEKHESTRRISESIGGNGHLVSIDIEKSHISIAKQIVKNHKNVTWIESDSLSFLKNHSENYHFILLDSANDMNHIFSEFEICFPILISGGVMIIDDCGIDQYGKRASGPQQKGVKVFKFCKENNLNYEIITSNHGFQLIIYK